MAGGGLVGVILRCILCVVHLLLEAGGCLTQRGVPVSQEGSMFGGAFPCPMYTRMSTKAQGERTARMIGYQIGVSNPCAHACQGKLIS